MAVQSVIRSIGSSQDSADIAVIIATYGDKTEWQELAERAFCSADHQSRAAQDVVWLHDDLGTLASVRNAGAYLVRARWLIFLDADDELDYRYVEVMERGIGDIRQPSTLGVVDGVEDDDPVLIPSKHLLSGNYLVIGSMLRRQQFLAVDGFDEYALYEDWALFVKLWLDGAEITACPDAVYRVHINTVKESRNFRDPTLESVTLRNIQQRFYPQALAKGLI